MQENPINISENPVQQTASTGKMTDSKAFLFSLVALGLVVAFSVIMFVMAQIKHASTSSTVTRTQELQTQITTLKSDKTNTVASLVSDNSIPSIQLTPLVAQFRNAATKAQVQFQGFNVQNDTISTNLTAINADKDAVQKIIAMMKDFAKNGQQGTFALEPILSISGDRMTRTTPVTFKVVPVKTAEAPVAAEQTPAQ